MNINRTIENLRRGRCNQEDMGPLADFIVNQQKVLELADRLFYRVNLLTEIVPDEDAIEAAFAYNEARSPDDSVKNSPW